MSENEEFEFRLRLEREQGAKAAPQVAPTSPQAAAPQRQPVQQFLGNLGAGALRGAGSIGATLLTPYDMLRGNTKSIGNPERRADMDAALQMLGADTGSVAFGAGKLGGEIAGTLGAGGAIANTAARIPGVATKAAPALEALRTAGMSTGLPAATTRAGQAGNMALRMGGGGVSGAASVGLVNPEDAQTGALVGMAAPPALKVLGAAGQAVGSTLRGPAQPAQLAAAVQDARQAGYVIPPTQAKPTLGNRVLEGFSGKITTAQNASAKNQTVTNRLAAEALGLPGDTQLTTAVLDKVRADAGKAYAALEALPKRPAMSANTLTNQPAVPALDPKAAVFDLRKARNDATAWFRSYGRTADPDSLAKAQSAASQAKRLESELEQYASGLDKPELVDALREARTLIAKTYTVENALNVASGSVNARKLAADLQKGKPLSGGLKQAASFADQFPKAAQAVEGMGSLPQTSPLDWALSGSLSALTANPLMLAGVAARPMARAAVLSGPVQNRLVQQPRGPMANALMDPELQRLLLRGAPLTAADR